MTGFSGGCTDGVDALRSPPPSPTPTVVVPALPDAETVSGLLGEVYEQPEARCSELWYTPPAFPFAVACLASGTFSDLSYHTGRTTAVFIYPPPDLSLEGTRPVARWLGHSMEILEERLEPCFDWRPLLASGVEGLACDDRGWGNPYSDAARVVLASDELLVLVDVSADLTLVNACDVLLNPSECPDVDIDYLEGLVLETAQRLLAMT